MKRSKRLYVLSGVLAVICGVTFGVSRYEQRKEEIRNSDEIILELAAEDVTALSWEYDETKLAFHKNEKWLYDDDEAFPVSEEKMNELLGLFESFGVSFVIENVEDYSQYGLDDLTCSIHIETTEESYEVELGGYSTMDEQRYISIGDGNVYLVSADPMETYGIELKDMILHLTLIGRITLRLREAKIITLSIRKKVMILIMRRTFISPMMRMGICLWIRIP